MKPKSIPLVLVALSMSFGALTALESQAQAGAEGGLSIFEFFFGSPRSDRMASKKRGGTGTESCDQYDGIIGSSVNSFFCHMEKDMGITGVGSSTKVFGNFTVRAEIAATAPAITINSTVYNYKYEAKVWICLASCSNAANFNRAYYVAWSGQTGVLIAEPGAFDSTAGTALFVHYDLASSSKFVTAKTLFTQNSTTYKMDARATKGADGALKVNVIQYNGSHQFRFAAAKGASSTTRRTALFYFESDSIVGVSTGVAPIDNSALSAIANSSGACFSATEEEAGTTAVGASNAACSSLSLNAFQAYALTATGTPSVQGNTQASIQTSTGTLWNGMAANPNSI